MSFKCPYFPIFINFYLKINIISYPTTPLSQTYLITHRLPETFGSNCKIKHKTLVSCNERLKIIICDWNDKSHLGNICVYLSYLLLYTFISLFLSFMQQLAHKQPCHVTLRDDRLQSKHIILRRHTAMNNYSYEIIS